MSAAPLTPERVEILARTRPGREAAAASKRALTRARMEEATFLLSCGMSAEEASRRAGWPTVAAAARSTYRAGNVALARKFERVEKARRRAAEEVTR